MSYITIKWTRVDYENLNLYHDAPFYSFTRNGKLLYIGISPDQNSIDEINQNLTRLRLPYSKIVYRVGYITESNYDRHTRKLIEDAECLIIYLNQPQLNTICIDGYNTPPRRDNFRVKCTNHPQLYSKVSVLNGKFYYRS